MAERPRYRRVSALKTAADVRQHLADLDVDLPVDDDILRAPDSPLASSLPVGDDLVAGNRFCIHPMEGWDGTEDGLPTDNVRRRWRNFGISGAKLIWGGEACAVVPEGRANPNQLMAREESRQGLAELHTLIFDAHRERFGDTDDFIVGLQLTHSGRFCRPFSEARMEPVIAHHHPILDRKFHVDADQPLITDDELRRLIDCYITGAKIAHDIGYHFVDVKHCHGYLGHELLGAHTRPGDFGGSFENRTRFLREIVAGIRAATGGGGNPIAIGVRLSAFDFVPFMPDPTGAVGSKLGPGIPEDFSDCLPYDYGFGVDADDPLAINFAETFRFLDLLGELDITLVNLSCGSPYYNPHIQRPALFPPSDGYQPPEDPLVGVARQVNAVKAIKQRYFDLAIVGSGYSYLQEYLPHVGQALVRDGAVDSIGLGRMVLSYPDLPADVLEKGAMTRKLICRTFSDCTTAPRNGMISGCYPLDAYYKDLPEATQLKELKAAAGD